MTIQAPLVDPAWKVEITGRRRWRRGDGPAPAPRSLPGGGCARTGRTASAGGRGAPPGQAFAMAMGRRR